MVRRPNLPTVPGVLTATEVAHTAAAIARAQEPSGALPWFSGGHVDAWNHVEAAMALSVGGLFAEADAAYEWSRRTQATDGSWPAQLRTGRVEDATADTNFCAYIAVGVWHHFLITGNQDFAHRMWPVVRRAMDFVLGLQVGRGEIGWARTTAGETVHDALLSGCSSIHHSLRCALALAAWAGQPQPEWEVALGELGHVIRDHRESFMDKSRYSMDWYYPVLGGAVRGDAGRYLLDTRWSDFVVDGLGARCVDDHPWVTGAETCELALSLDAIGERTHARDMLAVMQHLRDPDGSYWTGLVYTDGLRWPEERTTWTGAAVLLAADALAGATSASGIFRGEELPMGLATDDARCGCRSLHASGVPG